MVCGEIVGCLPVLRGKRVFVLKYFTNDGGGDILYVVYLRAADACPLFYKKWKEKRVGKTG